MLGDLNISWRNGSAVENQKLYDISASLIGGVRRHERVRGTRAVLTFVQGLMNSSMTPRRREFEAKQWLLEAEGSMGLRKVIDVTPEQLEEGFSALKTNR